MNCPRCDSPKIAPIAYGYPGNMDAYLKAVDEGVIILGGCLIEEESPSWGCTECHHRWGTLDHS